MKIEKEKLEELKKRYPDIYEASISFMDEENNPHEVEFLYRKPRVANMEMFNKAVQKNALDANLNLLGSLVVWPDTKNVVDKLQPYAVSVRTFIDDVITPFFGASVTAKSRRL